MAIPHSFGNALNLNFHGSTETFAFVCCHDDWFSRLRNVGYCSPSFHFYKKRTSIPVCYGVSRAREIDRRPRMHIPQGDAVSYNEEHDDRRHQNFKGQYSLPP